MADKIEKGVGEITPITTVSRDFTEQAKKLVEIKTATTKVTAVVDDWREIWGKLSREKKKEWLTNKTVPTIAESYDTYLRLKELFGEVDDD